MTWLRAFASAMPRIRAAESLRRALEVALGAGQISPDDSRRLRSEWERDAAATHRRQSVAEVRGLAAAMGIGVVEEKA